MMKQIRDLEFQYIVATDLAARGIDIQGISHVINYELPDRSWIFTFTVWEERLEQEILVLH